MGSTRVLWGPSAVRASGLWGSQAPREVRGAQRRLRRAAAGEGSLLVLDKGSLSLQAVPVRRGSPGASRSACSPLASQQPGDQAAPDNADSGPRIGSRRGQGKGKAGSEGGSSRRSRPKAPSGQKPNGEPPSASGPPPSAAAAMPPEPTLGLVGQEGEAGTGAGPGGRGATARAAQGAAGQAGAGQQGGAAPGHPSLGQDPSQEQPPSQGHHPPQGQPRQRRARAGERGVRPSSRGLVVCVGEPVMEFVPCVRASPRQAPDQIFASWRSMQWVPPEFARAPGSTSCQVAAALGRMEVATAFVGVVGDDDAGRSVVSTLRQEGVGTDGVVVSASATTALREVPRPLSLLTSLRSVEPGSASAKPVRGAGSSAPRPSLADVPAVRQLLDQASWVHCTALSFTGDPETAVQVDDCIHAAMHPNWTNLPQQQGQPAPGVWEPELVASAEQGEAVGQDLAQLFLDANLPLVLWRSRDTAWAALDRVWARASVVELSRAEAEFLIGEEPYVRRREARCKYAAESYAQLRSMHDDYHYSREEIAPLWDRAPEGCLELLLITDGTINVHYYTAEFDGSVDGTEDVLVAALTCDRAGSGDALVAGIIRKLVENPHVLYDQDQLERAIRFAISAGVIAQWTTGAVRSFPSAEATQNLTEQMFLTTLV